MIFGSWSLAERATPSLLAFVIFMNLMDSASAIFRHRSLFNDTTMAAEHYFSIPPENPWHPSNVLYKQYIVYSLLNYLFADYLVDELSTLDQDCDINVLGICTLEKSKLGHFGVYDDYDDVPPAYLDSDLFGHLSTIFGGLISSNSADFYIDEDVPTESPIWFKKSGFFIMHVFDKNKEFNSTLSKISPIQVSSTMTMSINKIWSADYNSLGGVNTTFGGHLMVEGDRINYMIYRYFKHKRELASFSAFYSEAAEVTNLLIEAVDTEFPKNVIGSCVSFYHDGPSAVYIKFLETGSDLTFDDIPCEGMMGWGALA
ncbi:hypothetical protein KAFR_0F04440 [Kazachstania africana CBS 2517]|uniref:Uncharacterized protein n=1 Tax=Kazachstania africana (strain ATCC 22294 / BCRC 22015 / CBS 2517 / CECT 1963 / NBRC 1671 / NRRL Y-8276) TaxID=1071382 RepID=H2AXD9_KAZAF|nr:hypothetical protein KAFR_0F04440 [Kazachstania africana CBS 2517]CCF59039.1 hypothetical protein KAFR_0F04440 [Kazachstania africana CBS 2517]